LLDVRRIKINRGAEMYLVALAAPASGSSSAPILHPIDFRSSGGSIIGDGVRFILKGAVWKGAEGPGDLPGGLDGVHAHSVSHYMETLSTAGFNAVRIDFNHQAVLDANLVEHFDPRVEPALVGKNYVQALKYLLQQAGQHGLLAALACTRLSTHDSLGNGLWHSAAVPEEATLRSWTKITNALCDCPSLFAVNLFDSPYGATWGVGGPHVDWHAAAQRLGEHVLCVKPIGPVAIG
jgi:hypothetical protein